MKVILDADVLIGSLDANDAHHFVSRRLLTELHERGDIVAVNAVNLTEVLVGQASEPARLSTARTAIATLGVRIQSPSEALAVEAARLRGKYPISVPDAYCLATAKMSNSLLASFDLKLRKAAADESVQLALAL